MIYFIMLGGECVEVGITRDPAGSFWWGGALERGEAQKEGRKEVRNAESV